MLILQTILGSAPGRPAPRRATLTPTRSARGRSVWLLAATLVLGACGQRGPLTLPPPPDAAASGPSAAPAR